MESGDSTGSRNPEERFGGPFELAFRARAVELTVFSVPEGAHRASAGEVCAALKDLPLDSFSLEKVLAAVKGQSGEAVVVGEVELRSDTVDDWVVKVSPSKLVAYVVPKPVECDLPGSETPGPVVGDEELRARLSAFGVVSGLLEGVITSFSPGRRLESVEKVAEGVPATPGRDATLELAFDPNPHNAPVEQEDGSVDYRAAVVQRFVDEGALLVTRHPPVPGEPGKDVFGNAVAPRPASDRALATMRGKATTIVGDTLVAAIGGRPVVQGEKIEVLAVYEVAKDVDFSIGNIEFNGDVIIGGDVHPGFSIRAAGSVIVRGIVDRASVTAGKDITARGITGDAHSRIEAGNDVVANYIHNASVTAGAMVKAHREIVNCVVHATRVQTAPAARIVGGTIEAVVEVDAGTIGSPRGVPTEVTVLRGAEGHPPVVRARHSIHSRVTLKVHHVVFAVDDDYKGTSFWEFEGEISQLGPAASAPKAA